MRMPGADDAGSAAVAGAPIISSPGATGSVHTASRMRAKNGPAWSRSTNRAPYGVVELGVVADDLDLGRVRLVAGDVQVEHQAIAVCERHAAVEADAGARRVDELHLDHADGLDRVVRDAAGAGRDAEAGPLCLALLDGGVGDDAHRRDVAAATGGADAESLDDGPPGAAVHVVAEREERVLRHQIRGRLETQVAALVGLRQQLDGQGEGDRLDLVGLDRRGGRRNTLRRRCLGCHELILHTAVHIDGPGAGAVRQAVPHRLGGGRLRTPQRPRAAAAPRASSAASVEECVQPAPCVVRRGSRTPAHARHALARRRGRRRPSRRGRRSRSPRSRGARAAPARGARRRPRRAPARACAS